MLVIGFDFGMKYIGVAVGQSITKSANALTTLKANNGIPDWQAIKILLSEWQPEAIIVGIPWNLKGERDQIITAKAEAFAKALAQFNIPVHTVDEHLTTKEARRQLFNQGGFRALKKEAVDSFSAKLIVESWLESSE